MLRNYEEQPGKCPPGVEIAYLSAFVTFPGFPSRPTTIFTYLPSTSGSCIDAQSNTERMA